MPETIPTKWYRDVPRRPSMGPPLSREASAAQPANETNPSPTGDASASLATPRRPPQPAPLGISPPRSDPPRSQPGKRGQCRQC